MTPAEVIEDAFRLLGVEGPEDAATVVLGALAGAGMVVVSADDYRHLLDRTEQFAMHRFDADDSVLVARLRAALPERTADA
ncbi:hypothetical protein ETD86_34745 [Nonomuraea turkmeniaca]|uniref:Uncharacterized protein n=1 Tax=Nonomuraea turkmeniaca TaxID=103838 RepID=A0A5S4F614_9ACTN|nr:hypothetical protein [Nonomuraea turkmeniaca]TMR11730.1 hypothetical protein ETD86_34745 [Nonomuraea turkmeniaca]